MTYSKNTANIIGRLGKDPESIVFTSGRSMVKFSVATDSRYQNKEGAWVKNTEWHQVVCWGEAGITCMKYLKKGDIVSVEGDIRTNRWENKNKTVHYSTEINAKLVCLLSPMLPPKKLESAV